MPKSVDEVVEQISQLLEAKNTELAAKERELEPLRKDIQELQGMLRGRGSGLNGSGDVSDDDIIDLVMERGPLTTREIAAAFDGDGRGFSKRLPRMVREGLLAGGKDGGYYVPRKRSHR